MLKIYSYQRVLKAFEKLGFNLVRQSKHAVLKDSRDRTVIMPRFHHNGVNTFTLRKILKQVQIDIQEFIKVL